MIHALLMIEAEILLNHKTGHPLSGEVSLGHVLLINRRIVLEF